MRPVADNVHALGTRGHNFYVLTDGDEATIVDAGCSKEWPKLLAGLDELGMPVEAIRGIIATHAHADHFGFAKRAHQEGLDVQVHEDEKSRAEGTYTGRFAVSANELPIFNLKALRTFLPMVWAGVMRLDHLEQVGTFSDGQRLDLPGGPIAVHTPGHTEGHTMFHLPDVGVLFTGDGLITMNLIGPGQGPQLIDDRFNLDTRQAMRSLDRIVGLDASLLLPGHGPPWSGSPTAAVAIARGER